MPKKQTDESIKRAEQSGSRPEGPMPEQSQARPGLERDVHPRPQYRAPAYKGSGKLKGLAALITGGDSGIGRSVAVLFAREGADVAVIHLPAEEPDAKETVAAVEAEGRKCLTIAGDVKDPQFCRQAVAKVVEAFGRLDVLVKSLASRETRS